MYSDVSLFIDGAWTKAAGGRSIDIVSPATGERIGSVAHADRSDLDRALEAAEKGFHIWRKISAFDRSKIMRKAANLLRERADAIAPLMTMEQGKPLPEAKGEVLAGADVIDWFAEEARRAYGRVIPARGEGIYQLVVKEPVGPVAAFTPWNFPINRRAGRRDQPGLWRAGGDLRIPDPASDHPEDVVHRLDRHRQAACGAGGCGT
jgi:succinate-semialdehyde dehydrogenase/glutarate-semialdehyde dehydrogenase